MNRKKIGARLQQVREQSGLGRATVCEKVGIGTTTLRQWEVGATEVSLETLEQLARLYKVSPQYLIFGTDGDTPPPAPTATSDDKYCYIPAYDIEASAGHGSFTDGTTTPQKHLAFRQHWIKTRGLRPKDLAVIFTKGDSMTPTIPEGSAVVIDQSKNQALDGKIYVIRIDDRLYVKRTQWLIGGGLRLISDNQRYQPLDITPTEWQNEQIQICGQVIHASYDLL